jgi:hypothetical protein
VELKPIFLFKKKGGRRRNALIDEKNREQKKKHTQMKTDGQVIC